MTNKLLDAISCLILHSLNEQTYKERSDSKPFELCLFLFLEVEIKYHF